MSAETIASPENDTPKPTDIRDDIDTRLGALDIDDPRNVILRLALLRHLNLTDSVTGLLNFAGLIEEVDQLRSNEECKDFTVFKINIGGFSRINSGFSHEFGDKFLTIFAEQLQSIAYRSNGEDNKYDDPDKRKNPTIGHDIAARIQGDEFALVLPNEISGSRKNEIEESIISAFENTKKIFLEEVMGIPRQGQEESATNSKKSAKDILDEVTIKIASGAFMSGLSDSSESLLGDIEDPKVANGKFSLSGLPSEIRDAAVRTVHGKLRREKQANPENPEVTKLKEQIKILETQLFKLIGYIPFDRDGKYDGLPEPSDSDPGIESLDELGRLLEKAINTDELSGINNRHWFETKIVEHLKSLLVPESDSGRMMVLMIDRGRFSEVNELNSDERDAGDRVIKVYSESLKKYAKDFSKYFFSKYGIKIVVTPARTGGDEFHLLINIDGNLMLSSEEIQSQVHNEIIDKADEELKKYLKYTKTLHPNIKTHTGRLTDITLFDYDGGDKAIDTQARLRELIGRSEVSKAEITRLESIAEGFGKIACIGVLVEPVADRVKHEPSIFIRRLGEIAGGIFSK